MVTLCGIYPNNEQICFSSLRSIIFKGITELIGESTFLNLTETKLKHFFQVVWKNGKHRNGLDELFVLLVPRGTCGEFWGCSSPSQTGQDAGTRHWQILYRGKWQSLSLPQQDVICREQRQQALLAPSGGCVRWLFLWTEAIPALGCWALQH